MMKSSSTVSLFLRAICVAFGIWFSLRNIDLVVLVLFYIIAIMLWGVEEKSSLLEGFSHGGMIVLIVCFTTGKVPGWTIAMGAITVGIILIAGVILPPLTAYIAETSVREAAKMAGRFINKIPKK